MGENLYDSLQFFVNGKPLHSGDFGCGIITKPSPNDAERFAKLKSEMDAMTEKYKPTADKLVEEIYKSSQESINPLGETTTQRISKSRKHYKPKFTL